MAAPIPAKLKTADVQRFATRAAQLEKYRPVAAYWLEYFVLQIILNKQLHTTDDEVQAYAIQLMDKLEAYKSANAANDAVVDDLAAKAYMEEFALETFERADAAQRADKVTRATADTFQAAAAFLDVQAIWAPLEGECAAKSKFAKFHALRIAKALKAGEDPNATNPKVEEPAKPAAAEDDEGLEAELKELEGAGQGGAGAYKSPTAETVPNSGQPSRPESTLQGGPSAPPTLPAQNINEPPTDKPSSPPDDPAAAASASADRTASIGGGYFPSVPSAPSATPTDPSTFYSAPASAPDPPSPPPPIVPSAPSLPPPPTAPALQSPFTPMPQAPAAAPTPPPAPAPGAYNTDDEAVLAAQKHAKWAISALNFEDVPTAVKELRGALRMLGAS